MSGWVVAALEAVGVRCLIMGGHAVHGVPGRWNYDNRQFPQKAATSGLVVDGRGDTGCDLNGRFMAFLREHGAETPALTSRSAAGGN